ncbi:MAG: hypothetical protein EPN62_19775 [Candidimonas sp.]|nr:MAG: hypothetical protein EPN62_19775 [Candidimonas sp.]
MERITELDILSGKRLCTLRVLGSWSPDRHAPSPCGAILFEFEDLSVLCLSPLRFRASQQGSTYCLESGAIASFGFLMRLADSEMAATLVDAIGPSEGTWEGCWTHRAIPQMGARLEAVGAVNTSIDSWVMKFVFEGDAVHQLRYRPDLDGSLEFSEPEHRHRIEIIEVLHPNQPFGWLHPAAPLCFAFEEHCWPSAAMRDWPFSLRKALRASSEPERLRRDVLLRAMRARFAQHPRLQRRLTCLSYPVMCPDCPPDIYEALKAS